VRGGKGEHAFSDAYPTITDISCSNIGVVKITLASFMHAFCYVLTESLMTVDKVSPEMLCSCPGFSSMTIYSTWQFWWTIPRWKELVNIPVEMHGSQITEVPPVAETSAINVRMLHLSPSKNGGGEGGSTNSTQTNLG
jgi:hypothetical protein